jgi:nitrate reductase delta subunit
MKLFENKPIPASQTLKVFARLLSYPDAQLRAHLDEMQQVLNAEATLSVSRREELAALMGALKRGDPLETEGTYVELFDRGHSTSLHLFEHVHGDSRDRGPAMIDLTQTYEKAGLFLAPGELPDYLPVLLEFVSTQPPHEARAFLGEMAHIFNAIFNALQQRQSAYASVLGALLELSGEKAQAVKVEPDESIDASWEEPVVFGGCSVKGQAKPGQAQPIHFVKNDAARPNAAHAGVTA